MDSKLDVEGTSLDFKDINITQKIEEIRQLWIYGLKEGNTEIQYFFWHIYLWHLGRQDESTKILSEEEYIDILVYQCKHRKLCRGGIVYNLIYKIPTDNGRYVAYRRMIRECKREAIEEYLRSDQVSNNIFEELMFLALVEEKWKNDSDIEKIMNKRGYARMFERALTVKSKSALLYILNKIKISEIMENFRDRIGIRYCYSAPFLLFLFSKGKFLYNSMICTCLKLCKNDTNFKLQLSINMFNDTYLDELFNYREDAKFVYSNMFEEFIWFLLEIDFYKYLSEKKILYNIKQEKFKGTGPMGEVILNKIKKQYTRNKKKLTNIIDNGYAPYIPKDIVGIIKKYMVFYEHMLKI